jgi:hypothetical protein
MRHWRSEVEDVASTLREACQRAPEGPLQAITRTAALLRTITRRTPQACLLFSDDAGSRMLATLAAAGMRPPVARLWWNDAEQIDAFEHPPLEPSTPRLPLHIGFFPEILSELPAIAARVLYAPYVFTPPQWRPLRHRRSAICYTAEVNISDHYLHAVFPASEVPSRSEIAWDLARQTLEGHRDLYTTDHQLRQEYDPTPQYRAVLTTVRNRLRYLLVCEIHRAFPHRFRLRGTDWKDLGFDAAATSRGPFRRVLRLHDYRSYRVALDLGTKSSHARMSPRAADIMAVGGGLAQFSSSSPVDRAPAALAARHTAKVSTLLTTLDTMLSQSSRQQENDDRELYEAYATFRLNEASSLCQSLAHLIETNIVSPGGHAP